MKKFLLLLSFITAISSSTLIFATQEAKASFHAPTLKIWYRDADGDSYGDADTKKRSFMKPLGYVADKRDCNDSYSNAYPGAPEIWYNGIDNDCSGGSDYDQDGDSYDNMYYKATGDTEYTFDCDDTNVSVHPLGTEIYGNGVDENCDGEAIIETYTDPVWACWWSDNDWDGYGAPGDESDSPFTCSWRYENRRVWWMDTADTLWSFQVNDEGQDCDDTDDSIYAGTSTCTL